MERAREEAIPHDRDPPPETSVHQTLNRRKPQPKLRHRPRGTLLQSADNAKVMGSLQFRHVRVVQPLPIRSGRRAARWFVESVQPGGSVSWLGHLALPVPVPSFRGFGCWCADTWRTPTGKG